MVPAQHFLFIAAALFVIGLIIVITRKNAIMMLIGIELMLNAANLNLVVFSRADAALSGQVFALFVIVVAAAEAAVGLAIVLKVYQLLGQTNPDQLNQLKD